MTRIVESLQREEQTDEEFRSRYHAINSISSSSGNAKLGTNGSGGGVSSGSGGGGSSGSGSGGLTMGPPSKHLNQDILAITERLRQAFLKARSSDENITKELQDPTFLTCMETLTKDKQGLTDLLPKPTEPLLDLLGDGDQDGGGAGSLPEMHTLEKHLFELAGIVEQREVMVQQLRDRVLNKNLTELVLSSPSQISQSNSLLPSHPPVKSLTESSQTGPSEQPAFPPTAAAAQGQNSAILPSLLAICEGVLQNEMTTAASLAKNIQQSIASQHTLLKQITLGKPTLPSLALTFPILPYPHLPPPHITYPILTYPTPPPPQPMRRSTVPRPILISHHITSPILSLSTLSSPHLPYPPPPTANASFNSTPPYPHLTSPTLTPSPHSQRVVQQGSCRGRRHCRKRPRDPRAGTR